MLLCEPLPGTAQLVVSQPGRTWDSNPSDERLPQSDLELARGARLLDQEEMMRLMYFTDRVIGQLKELRKSTAQRETK